MAAVVWSPQALDDLDAICLYIARDSPRVAEVFAGRVFRAVERLEDFPLSGRIVPELAREDLREIILSSYRIIYHVAENEARVLTIHHGARLLPNLDPADGE